MSATHRTTINNNKSMCISLGTLNNECITMSYRKKMNLTHLYLYIYFSVMKNILAYKVKLII